MVKNLPRAITEVRRAAFLEALESGLTILGACRASGVPRTSLYRALGYADDPDADPACAAFRADMESARATAQREAIGVIREAGRKGDWRAAAWYLAKSFPDEYGDRVQVQQAEAEVSPDLRALARLERMVGIVDGED